MLLTHTNETGWALNGKIISKYDILLLQITRFESDSQAAIAYIHEVANLPMEIPDRDSLTISKITPLQIVGIWHWVETSCYTLDTCLAEGGIDHYFYWESGSLWSFKK